MSRPKTRQVGTAGLVTRYRNGICVRTCRRCHQADTPPSWRTALRDARAHARDHQATDAGDVGTPWGIPAHELPRPAVRGARPLRRLAIAVAVLALTALILPALLGPLTSHAAPAPAAPSTSIASTTTPGPEGYMPTLAGPPATDANGAWIPAPDEPPAQASSDAGGGR